MNRPLNTPTEELPPSRRPFHRSGEGGCLEPVDSHALLNGQREVLIHHQGSVYRLQATRQGKLILTK